MDKIIELIKRIEKLEEKTKIIKSEEWLPQIIKEKKLEWGKSSDTEMNWEDAKKWCETQGGRLPTIVELTEAYHGKIEGFKKEYYYWSSSEYSSINPFTLSFNNGNVRTYSVRSEVYYVRVCKGG